MSGRREDGGPARVLVCGGRDYADTDHIHNELWRIDKELGPIEAVIHGCATGADLEADIWAAAAGYKALGFRAEWSKHGRAAGPIRNQRMLDEGRPTVVVAFPGGRGTADMVRRAKAAGIRVIEVAHRAKSDDGGER